MAIGYDGCVNLLDSQVPPYGEGQREEDGGGVQDLREVHVEQHVHGPGVRPVLLPGEQLWAKLLIKDLTS